MRGERRAVNVLGKVNILCAVRDRRMAESLKRELDDGEHCTMQIVTDGRAVLSSSRQCAPDIVVIDAMLPGMDGLGVVDCLREMLGDRMPRVIGGSMMPFSDEGFRRRGARAVVHVPWQREELRDALMTQMNEIDHFIDWEAAHAPYQQACALLDAMGMHDQLKGFTYLAWASALAYENEARLFAVGKRLYQPIAERFGTTPQSVERLIRHAVESTMDAAAARGVYGLFGNTLDPARGKPTNAQIIGMLVQRMRVA